MVSSFLALIKAEGKSEWERKEERRCLSGRGSQAPEAGTGARPGCCFCSCLTEPVGQPAPTLLLLWDRTQLPKGKEN